MKTWNELKAQIHHDLGNLFPVYDIAEDSSESSYSLHSKGALAGHLRVLGAVPNAAPSEGDLYFVQVHLVGAPDA
jgi:hypothetical protein